MSTITPEEQSAAAGSEGSLAPDAGLGPAYEDFFTYRLSLLVKLIERRTADQVFKATRLTLSEGRAVMIVAAHQPIRVQDIATRSHLDKSQASRVTESLMSRGLVSKAGSDTDRRAASITLTEAGRAVHAQLIDIHRGRNAHVLRHLTTPQRRALITQLDRLVADATD